MNKKFLKRFVNLKKMPTFALPKRTGAVLGRFSKGKDL
jgi:hypothetical protein